MIQWKNCTLGIKQHLPTRYDNMLVRFDWFYDALQCSRVIMSIEMVKIPKIFHFKVAEGETQEFACLVAAAVLTIASFCDKHLNLSWIKTSMWIKSLVLMKFSYSYLQPLCIQEDSKLVPITTKAVSSSPAQAEALIM